MISATLTHVSGIGMSFGRATLLSVVTVLPRSIVDDNLKVAIKTRVVQPKLDGVREGHLRDWSSPLKLAPERFVWSLRR